MTHEPLGVILKEFDHVLVQLLCKVLSNCYAPLLWKVPFDLLSLNSHKLYRNRISPT